MSHSEFIHDELQRVTKEKEALEHELKQFQWIDVNERLPEHDQHVLVWEDRFNVYPFQSGSKGDDGDGRVRMWDAIYWSGQAEWDSMTKERQSRWIDVDDYRSMNQWDKWRWQGPCSFGDVTHWMPLPKPPTNKL